MVRDRGRWVFRVYSMVDARKSHDHQVAVAHTPFRFEGRKVSL